MNRARRRFVVFGAAGIVLAATPARGQRERRLPRIALVFGSIPTAQMLGADPAHPFARWFVHALRDLGLVDGRDIVLERRSAEGRIDRLPALMQEVVALRVDVIVTTGSPGARAAQRATETIPIVAIVNNALDARLIESLARPGRNVTGVGSNDPAIDAKVLQLLKEIAPSVTRVAILDFPAAYYGAGRNSTLDSAARSLGLSTVWIGVDAPEQLDAAFATTMRERVNALVVMGTHVNYAHRQRIGAFARAQRLPMANFTDAGGLFEYGDDFDEVMHRAAAQVKKILGGTKPADIPFEQPTRYTLVINQKAAGALGLTVPAALLARADEIIR